uniref:Uncharacterized protein n=1 Tax=Medicago truncatula TaxID=3880 RepID=Q2HTI3_MEDTR|nr:hypothetical protein MtrDRAFT_AC150441g6v1 [Medicago truncatula]
MRVNTKKTKLTIKAAKDKYAKTLALGLQAKKPHVETKRPHILKLALYLTCF